MPGILSRGARRALALAGWRVVAPWPLPARCVIVFYPHTSNWDFFVGLFAKWTLAVPIHWVAKASLFRWPVAGILRRLGGIPVDRSEPAGIVQRLVREFESARELRLAITPEGTRARTEGWKSGFYRIAVAARVPVVLAYVDYPRREIGYAERVTLAGDAATDIARIAAAYAGKTGWRPHCQGPVRLLGSGRE